MINSANSHQTGGVHYLGMDIQPWDIFDTWNAERQIGFHLGNIVKYSLRLGNKDDPIQEARKIAHYAQKLVEVLELAQAEALPDDIPWQRWADVDQADSFLQAQQDARLAQHMEDAWGGIQTMYRKKAKKAARKRS
jgi:hypothetical protein